MHRQRASYPRYPPPWRDLGLSEPRGKWCSQGSASLMGRDRYAKRFARGGRALFRCVLAGRIMRALVNRRGARTISLALAAGLLAFEAVLGLSAGAIGIPGLILFDIGGQDRESTPGGETVISKAEKNAEAQPAAPVQPASPRPTASLQS